MNQKLQQILDSIEQSAHLSEDEKNALAKTVKEVDKEIEITTFKLDRTEKVKRTTAILLEETIEELEQKRKAVEAQNRELEIESSLERVRTVAMSMNRPDDMLLVCRIISEQLELLNVKDIRNVQTAIINEAKGIYLNYEYFTQYKRTSVLEIVTKLHPTVEEFAKEMMKSKDAFFTKTFEGRELQDWREYRKKTNQDPDPILDEAKSVHYYFYSIGTGALGISAYAPLSEEEINLFKRFRNVFDLAYRRFIDIEKAIAQAREAKIEAALERTRTQSMIMQHSNELDDSLRVFHEQVLLLGINSAFSYLWLPDEKNERHIFWAAWGEGKNGSTVFKSKATNYPLNRNEPATAQCFVDWKSNEPVHSYHVQPDGVDTYFATWKELLAGVEKLKPEYFRDGLYYVEAFMKYGCFGVMAITDLTEEEKKLLNRFAIEFERTYTRFLDLQKAEAQAREAQIEAALERVRSRSMGMQKSEELKEVIKIVYQQLTHLKINLDHAGFVVDYTAGGDWHFWIADEQDIPSKITHPYFESVWANQFNEAKEKTADFFATHLNFEEKNKFYNELLSYVPGLPQASKDFYLNCPGLAASTVLFENVSLYIENFSGTPYTDEENTTLMRFGKVFQQTYTRFLDLQKAEAQAREAQIELGLERVRARAMAMQKSDELSELVDTVFKELTKLDFALTWCIINIIDEPSLSNTVWAANPDITQVPESYHMKFEDYPFHDAMMKGWKERKTKYEYVLEGHEKKVYDEYLFNETEFRKVPEAAQAASRAMEKYVATFSFSNFGGLQTVGDVPLSDANLDILSRFGKVFDLTYTRFNDLKQAEAQAREAKIENALEKVRSRTMAMQKSEELPEAANVLFLQVQSLGIPAWSCGYNILAADKRSSTCIMSSEGEIQVPFVLPLTEHPSLLPWYEAIQNNLDFFVYGQGGDDLIEHYRYLATVPGLEKVFQQFDDAGISLPANQINHLVRFTNGFLLFITYESVPHAHDIFKRFGKVFEQTYTRFLDLQKAEAQAREAQIEAALERVRSKTMAMQKSDDLFGVIHEVNAQLQLLNFRFDSADFLTDYSDKGYKIWVASVQEAVPKPFYITAGNTKIPLLLKETMERGDDFFTFTLNREEKNKYFEHVFQTPVAKDASAESKQFIYNAAGMAVSCFVVKNIILSVANFACIPYKDAENDILRRFAFVFEQSYTRFLDLQKAEAQAREAQIEASLERVRSKAMAMQKSEDLANAVGIVFEELDKLNLGMLRCGIGILNKE